MKKLNLQLHSIYTDETGERIEMVREFTPTDPDYVQGFRFRGSNGTNYTADGSVQGQIGDAQILQMNALPLIEEVFILSVENLFDNPLVIKLGDFYRNNLGMVHLITDLVQAPSSFYDKGYRFIDEQGTYYRPDGITVDKGFFTKLNIVDRVEAHDVTQEEMDAIHRRSDHRITRLNARDTAVRLMKKVGKPLAIGAAIGTGIGSLFGRRPSGATR